MSAAIGYAVALGLSKAFTSMCGYAFKRGANWYVLIAAAFLATSEAAYWPPRSAKTGEQRCERIQVEIKDGVCTGSIFRSFATCTWDTDGFNTTEQKGAFMSKNYSLSTDECLELTAGKGVAAGSLPGAKYLNAATVCPQIGGTSNATGWCVVGQAGAFCDYLQGAALTTECELYDWDEEGQMKSATYDVDAALTTDCEKCEKCQRGTGSETPCQCVPARWDPRIQGRKRDNRLCCEGFKGNYTGAWPYVFGLAELIWVTPGSEASKWLDNPVSSGVTLPHKWSPLCTGVDEAKFATFKAQLKSSGACSNDPNTCVGIDNWGSITKDFQETSALAVWVVLILVTCCGGVFCYFCCGTFARKRRESKMWKDEERQAFQHSMGQAAGNPSAETVVKDSHPDGQVLGPRVSECTVKGWQFSCGGA